MPELPEVETVRRILEPQIKGLRITDVAVGRTEVIAHPSAEEFCFALSGQIMDRIDRRGKFLIFRLADGGRMLVHLHMTGCLLATPAGYPVEKHTHLTVHLENRTELRFIDPRRFGRVWLIRKGEADTFSGIGRLGMEPFDEAFCADYLQNALGKRRKAIKECLLDQSVVAGIGNIYSDEILFEAGIRPSRPANTLRSEEWTRLAEAIPERLRYFTEKNTITPEEYLETKGQEYRNTPFLRVYGRGGKPCPVCGETLIRTVIGGRSSVFCPVCQPER